MKILYVEDELVKNIPRIIRLFAKYLGKQRIKDLEALEAKPSGFRADPEEVKRIVEDTGLIDVDKRFPEALQKILHQADRYALFLIDRNLAEYDYTYAEVSKIDAAYSETQYERFFEREGDYLLQKLVYNGVDVMTKFYFFTAYSARDELRSGKEIETHINFGKFTVENFIEKGSDADFERLQQVMAQSAVLNLQIENKRYLDILRTQIGDKAADKFLAMLATKDSGKEGEIAVNLGRLRNLLENILEEIARKVKASASCWNNRGELSVGHFIWWLTHDETTRSETYKFETNSLLKNFLHALQGIGSDFGVHEDLMALPPQPAGYQATSDTVNALVYELKDVISWFGGICKRFP